MIRYLLLVYAFGFLAFQNVSSQDYISRNDSIHYYIFSNKTKILIHHIDTFSIVKFQEEDFSKLDSLLINFLEDQKKHVKEGFFYSEIYNSSYAIQVMGLSNVKGETLAYLNAQCSVFLYQNRKRNKKTERELKKSWVHVYDGGSCFWQILLNLDTGEVEYIYVNGY